MDHEPQHHAQVAGNNLDKLAQLVGQDRALQAVSLVDQIKQNIADALAATQEVPVRVDVLDKEIEQLKQALLNRDAEIATLKEQIKTTGAAIEAEDGHVDPPTIEPTVRDGDVVVKPAKGSAEGLEGVL